MKESSFLISSLYSESITIGKVIKNLLENFKVIIDAFQNAIRKNVHLGIIATTANAFPVENVSKLEISFL